MANGNFVVKVSTGECNCTLCTRKIENGENYLHSDRNDKTYNICKTCHKRLGGDKYNKI